jgi:DNA-directed RNA polymerase subunit M/transcription elongation factor TFIIS
MKTFKLSDYYTNKIKKYNFITDLCKNIDYKLLKLAEKNIDRYATKTTFAILLENYQLATAIEKSIFEFSLKHISSYNLLYTHVINVYKDKVLDIYENLDPTSHIKNNFLLTNLLSGTIKPEIIAFLTREQMFPAKWQVIINKNQLKENVNNNAGLSDIYQCGKCGEKKCRVTNVQNTNDDSESKFVTCSICYYTIIC